MSFCLLESFLCSITLTLVMVDWLCQLEKFSSLTKLAQQFFTLGYRGPILGQLITWVYKRQIRKNGPASVLRESSNINISFNIIPQLLAQTLRCPPWILQPSSIDSSGFWHGLLSLPWQIHWLPDMDLYRTLQ